MQKKKDIKGSPQVGKAGDSLPPFRHHMIRQRVDRHGHISQLEPESELPGCNMPSSQIGVIKEGPIRKWMAAKKQWDTKFASSKRRVQKQRAKDMAKGYQQFGDGEVPPPSALAGRRKLGEDLKEPKKSRSMGMSLWSLWGSKHDEKTIVLEHEADKEPEITTATAADGANARPLHDVKTAQGEKLDARKKPDYSRSRSRRRTVTDQNQTGRDDVDENTPASVLHSKLAEKRGTAADGDAHLAPDFVADGNAPQILVRSPNIEKDESELKRPKADGIAFPFSLKNHHATASMTTLTSSIGIRPQDDIVTPGAKDSGVPQNANDVEASGKGKEEESEQVIENGQVVSAERPPMETFKTALEIMPAQPATKSQ
jgi:hypothetical protein